MIPAPVLRRVASSTTFKTILALGLLGYLVYIVDIQEITTTARTADVRLIVVAILLFPLNMFIEGTLWHRITALVIKKPRMGASFGSLMSGYALGLFTPGRIGELAGRSFYLDHHDKWALSALVMFQRLIDMVVGVSIGLLALGLFVVLARPQSTTFWWLVFATGAVTLPLLIFVLVRPAPAFRILSRILKKRSVLRPLAFLRTVHPRQVSPFVLLASLRYLTFVGQFVLLLYAFGAEGSILVAWMGAAMTFYGKYMIPSITIMDIGVREGSAVFFMGAVGVLQATAFNASLFLFLINLVIPAAAGIPFVLRLRMAGENVKEAAHARPVEEPVQMP